MKIFLVLLLSAAVFTVNAKVFVKNLQTSVAGIRVGSTWEQVMGETPVSTALTIPTVGVATNIAAKGFTANWSSVENATGYTVKVYWGTTFVDSTTVSGQAISSATIANLIPALTYTYKVLAKGDGFNHINSDLSANSEAFALLEAAIPNNNLKVILKHDDIGVLNSNFSAALTFDYLQSHNIKSGAGVVANRLDTTALGVLAPYINAVNELGDTLIELWHHGYDHSRNKETGVWEFYNRSYADQKFHFDTATHIFKTLLGVQLRSFAAPYNYSDSVTNRVIAEDPNYKVFMFGSLKSATNGISYLHNRVDFENGTGKPEYAFFVKNYNSKKDTYKDYMVLQGHPNFFRSDPSRLEQFKLIIQFLISEGVEFVRPYDYYKEYLKND